MGYSVIQSGESAALRAPIEGAGADVAAGIEAQGLADVVSLAADALEVRLSVSGTGDLRVRFDGGDPVAGASGELWYPGAIFTFTRAAAEGIHFVAEGNGDPVLHVSQWR